MELKNNEQPVTPLPSSHFLTAAIRSWMVNQLLDPEDIQELFFLLLELKIKVDKSFHGDPKLFLKKEMSLLAAKNSTESQEVLIKLCEGIVQFYLVRNQNSQKDLNYLNTLLPIGYTFNHHDGSLSFTEKSQDTLRHITTPSQSDTLDKNETGNTVEDPIDHLRSKKFKEIRQRRLALLKEWEKPNGKY